MIFAKDRARPSPFPHDLAEPYCKELLHNIATGSVTLEVQTSGIPQREEGALMLGVLVCQDNSGARVVLETVSGIRYMLKATSALQKEIIFVEPIVSAQDIEAALSKNDKKIHELTQQIQLLADVGGDVVALKKERAALTNESLSRVYALYHFFCKDKKMRSLLELFKAVQKNPPTGAGDCAAPKLLHYAFLHNLHPVSLGEFQLPKQRLGTHIYTTTPIRFIAPCMERCAIILPALLGLDIVYRDSDIIVVNKPSGLLSVPGRGPEKQDCVVSRVRSLFPHCIAYPAVHRLDMETSGLLLLAFTSEAYKHLSAQFEHKSVQKEYIALLDGILHKAHIPSHGFMNLYFRLDVENRPHQIWDSKNGKEAVTEWHLMSTERYRTPDGKLKPVSRVRFIPHTGRTHQLRLIAADKRGFGLPIIGDSLYGTQSTERLMLHASFLSFEHPRTGKRIELRLPAPF